MAKNPLDSTQITLIYANVKEDDILLRKELDTIAKEHPKRFKVLAPPGFGRTRPLTPAQVWHSLNEPPEGWTMGSGFVSADMIKEHLPAPGPDMKLLLCGECLALRPRSDESDFECLARSMQDRLPWSTR